MATGPTAPTSQKIIEQAADVGTVAFNVAFRASKLGHDGQSVAVIASYLNQSAVQISALVKDISRRIGIVSERLSRAVFDLAWLRLQYEMAVIYSHEVTLELGGDGRRGDAVRTGRAQHLQLVQARVGVGHVVDRARGGHPEAVARVPLVADPHDGEAAHAAHAFGERTYLVTPTERLTYSDAEIDALPVAAWKKTVLHAMHHHRPVDLGNVDDALAAQQACAAKLAIAEVRMVSETPLDHTRAQLPGIYIDRIVTA